MSEDEARFADEIGGRFRARRLALCLSQRQVAAKAGLHPNTIGALERGERQVGVTTFVLTACALGEDPGFFAEGIRWEPDWSNPGTGTLVIEPAAAAADG